ncbi:tyrosine-type recombinase/integrase [Roseovarius indicus]|uniref:Site-specific tyrosine recombinase XerC n=1 Tax=Roseovarius indicus TaxID=540747 RepID=A0A5P3AAU2_9RHOB|nr:site-specific integrase [Roseovarius indicus]QEW25813.1 site-specific tyrosine recombinase XerC [Roseovarius indicus]
MPQITPLEERVLKLPVRKSPYWETLEYCRHIGIQKTGQNTGHWVARIRNKSGGYKQSTLMSWHSEANQFSEAVEMACSWFSSPSVSAVAADPYPKGSKQGLAYCPWGSEFTLGHALDDYVKWKRIAATQSHFASLVSLINHHILPRLGHILLDELNGRHIIQFSVDVLETPPKRGNQKPGPRRKLAELSPDELRKRKKTLNTLIGVLRLAVKLAWENGSTESERAWRCIRRVPISDQPRTIFLSRQECVTLLESCRGDLRDLVQGALYTGCRVAELSNLKVRDVACDVFGIYVAPLKSRRPRYVFLPDEGLAFFLALCAGRMPDDYVFRHRSGYSWQGRHKHLFKEAVRNAGLPEEFVFHGLRHTYASQLVQAGTPLIVVSQQLGHANTDTVSRTYGHLAPQIREVQVRTHFAELDMSYAEKARGLSEKFQELSKSLQGNDWREYGKLEPVHSWPRSNFVTSDSEVAQLLLGFEGPDCEKKSEASDWR